MVSASLSSPCVGGLAVSASMNDRVCIRAFYRFVPLTELDVLREQLLAWGQAASLRGSILLAPEGINGTIAGTTAGLDAFFAALGALPALADLETKTSWSDAPPFQRFKVRLKREIVHFGVDGLDPVGEVGTYVEPEDWNALVEDPGVVVVDTRNFYEVGAGRFRGALQPETAHFRDFPAWSARHLDPARHPRVAMYCTGGIRCEKATALLRRQGFAEVFHLKGGILRYLEEVPPEASTWEGECFVFDERITVDHQLAPGNFELCPECQYPLEKSPVRPACPHCAEGRGGDA